MEKNSNQIMDFNAFPAFAASVLDLKRLGSLCIIYLDADLFRKQNILVKLHFFNCFRLNMKKWHSDETIGVKIYLTEKLVLDLCARYSCS